MVDQTAVVMVDTSALMKAEMKVDNWVLQKVE